MLKLFYNVIIIFTILFSISVVISKNPMYSLFSLILVFINSAILLLSLNLEFIALLILIIYAGAISVLFLFIILLFNLKNIKNNNTQNFFEKILFFLISLKFLIAIIYPFCISFNEIINFQIFFINDYTFQFIQNYFNINNDLYVIGNFFYDYYFFFLLLSGLILLIAMIGTISLTRK